MEVWIPRELNILQPIRVVPNGSQGNYRVEPLDGAAPSVKSEQTITTYYRKATKEEAAELLPEVA